MQGFDIQQKQQQSQVQIMSQRQIQSLSILSMGTDELKETVRAEVEKNPALVFKNNVRKGSVSFSGVQASDDYQKLLEGSPDQRQSLKDYLLEQLSMQNISGEERLIGEKLIGNLDSKGFHILAPVSLLDKKDKLQTEKLLEKCMGMIQHFDPVGTCVRNMEESLLVQANARKDCTEIAMFLLDGHFDFLDPYQIASILKKIKAYQKERKSMFGLPEEDPFLDLEVTEKDVAKALEFIKKLDPFPARNFSTQDVQYITPDVYIEKIVPDTDEEIAEDFDKGIVSCKGHFWKVIPSRDSAFELEINPLYKKYAGNNGKNPVVQEGIQSAENFIASIQLRQNTVLRACCHIVKRQHDFFEKGPGYLLPLKQLDIARILEVHESTVSRMANNKYIQSEWGLYSIKYFFVNAVSEDVSKDKILREIKRIIRESKADGKKLSDQKISDILQEHGIKIARRTVAKYRSML